jgi:hypothetical protein
MGVQTSTTWEPQIQLISTRLTGNIHLEDVVRWEAGLQQALAQIEENGAFKLLVDLSGYELRDMAAHKAMRVVIPQLLAAHNLRAAVLDLFPEAEVKLQRTRGIICRAVANVHHDHDKMAEYERTLARSYQHFFTNADEARTWLLSLDEEEEDRLFMPRLRRPEP